MLRPTFVAALALTGFSGAAQAQTSMPGSPGLGLLPPIDARPVPLPDPGPGGWRTNMPMLPGGPGDGPGVQVFGVGGGPADSVAAVSSPPMHGFRGYPVQSRAPGRQGGHEVRTQAAPPQQQGSGQRPSFGWGFRR